MVPRIARVVTLCCGIVTVLAANPSESHALCGLFDCLFGGCRTPTTTFFAPACSPCATTACSPCATSACSPCGAGACGASGCGTSACSPCTSTVCNYMPQTCFRAQCVNVPVTTFRCVSACDPCTGCPTTVMRPTTTFVRQVRYVPFTTFRPVCNTVMSPVATMPTVVAPTAVAPTPVPAATFSPVAPSSGCCSATSATISGPTIATPAPATTYAVPSQGSATVIQSAPANPSMPAIPHAPAPSLNSTPIQPLPRTDLKATPDNSINGSSSGSTWTYDPDSRTTRTFPRPRDEEKFDLVVPAVYSAPAKSLDDGGWRAARR